eukprot:1464435-Rhodomonas_salina.1
MNAYQAFVVDALGRIHADFVPDRKARIALEAERARRGRALVVIGDLLGTPDAETHSQRDPTALGHIARAEAYRICTDSTAYYSLRISRPTRIALVPTARAYAYRMCTHSTTSYSVRVSHLYLQHKPTRIAFVPKVRANALHFVPGSHPTPEGPLRRTNNGSGTAVARCLAVGQQLVVE